MRNVKNVWYPLCSPVGTKVNSSSLMELAVNICQLTVGSASGYVFLKYLFNFRPSIVQRSYLIVQEYSHH